ncbi:hypothetical protein TIFTF001_017454 [Ficus carica]|uniref:Uncharacterized protein n=1 Tax=Ficus carica TaxID=3494 RepID=A0AA88A516_FICCA|nr:hypothetical protein TIFTF001_017454 [Ficus carica]
MKPRKGLREKDLFSGEFGGIRKDEVDGELRGHGGGSGRARLHEGERGLGRVNVGDRLLPGLREGRVGGLSRRDIGREGSSPAGDGGCAGQEGGGGSAEHGEGRVRGFARLSQGRSRRSQRDRESEREKDRVWFWVRVRILVGKNRRVGPG